MFKKLLTSHKFNKTSPHALLIEAPDFEEVRAILTRHAVSEIPPETGVTRNHKLIRFRGHFLALQRVNDVRIVKTKNYRIINLRSTMKNSLRKDSRAKRESGNNSLYDSVSYSNDIDPRTLH